MLLYHGSTVIVETPEIRESVSCLDFGIGFYTTTSYEQAERWAKIKMRRSGADRCFVSVYEFNYEQAEKDTVIEHFKSADINWLNFVVNNRKGISQAGKADMHIGPVADDSVYASIRLFETGILDALETVKRLKTELLNDQWAFHTEKILDYCKFVSAKEITEEA